MIIIDEHNYAMMPQEVICRAGVVVVVYSLVGSPSQFHVIKDSEGEPRWIDKAEMILLMSGNYEKK